MTYADSKELNLSVSWGVFSSDRLPHGQPLELLPPGHRTRR